jgi:mono/diheme cytochrome c family protein
MVISTRWSAPESRASQVRYLGLWFGGGVLLAYGGYRWWEAQLPETVQALFLGASPALAALADTRHLVLYAMLASLVLGVILLFVFARRAGLVAAGVLMVASFTFFGAYERLREGVRKPFLIHSHMFSNGLLIDEIAEINERGFLAVSGWSAHGAASGDPVDVGEVVFKAQCGSCHTIDGYQGIRPLLPDDPDMIFGVLAVMWEMGEAYADADTSQMIDTAEFDYAYMPPFVGNDEELEALALYLGSLAEGPGQSAAILGGGQ